MDSETDIDHSQKLILQYIQPALSPPRDILGGNSPRASSTSGSSIFSSSTQYSSTSL